MHGRSADLEAQVCVRGQGAPLETVADRLRGGVGQGVLRAVPARRRQQHGRHVPHQFRQLVGNVPVLRDVHRRRHTVCPAHPRGRRHTEEARLGRAVSEKVGLGLARPRPPGGCAGVAHVEVVAPGADLAEGFLVLQHAVVHQDGARRGPARGQPGPDVDRVGGRGVCGEAQAGGRQQRGEPVARMHQAVPHCAAGPSVQQRAVDKRHALGAPVPQREFPAAQGQIVAAAVEVAAVVLVVRAWVRECACTSVVCTNDDSTNSTR